MVSMRNLLLSFAFVLAARAQDANFIELPYLQLGDQPHLSASESLVLLWHAPDLDASWSAELRTSKDAEWRAASKPSFQTAGVPDVGIAPHRIYRVTLTELAPGEDFRYRVLKSGAPVFTATGKARKDAGQPYRLVLFGDCAQNTPEQRQIAYQASLAKPDFLFITGDIVYTFGRISEYRTNYFPIYNSNVASVENGAPLLRSIPFLAAPGNHDTALLNYSRYPDALAYFLYWDQPLNGPVAPVGMPNTAHTLIGNADAQPAFLQAARPRYPRMANFSFDYGNTHWTVLDSNPYMDWQNPALLQWVKEDLAQARNAQWRFVSFHHPGFNSSVSHFTDQWMRLLAPTFEQGKVDVVFSGHVHNYQRSFPLTFKPKKQDDGNWKGPKGEVAGEFVLDKKFENGATTKPKGIVYIVSGAGGAHLYNPEQQDNPQSWQPFTNKYIAQVNSMSVIDVDGRTFRMKQIDTRGEEVDRFEIKK